MYQSIRILKLVCPIYKAPHRHPHDKKGHLPNDPNDTNFGVFVVVIFRPYQAI